jgi:peroxiredoxin (alkyl hydroperoxide reductase subunit C)
MVSIGQKAPDFTAPAYHRGAFTSVTLSDFADTWILLYFYPGDFTFV